MKRYARNDMNHPNHPANDAARGAFDGKDGRSFAPRPGDVPPVPQSAYPTVRVYRTGDYRGRPMVTLDFGNGDAYFEVRRLARTDSASAVWAITINGGYHFPSINAGNYEPSLKLAIVYACEWRARILAVRRVYGS